MEKKKVRFQTLLETKKILPEQEKYTANLTSFRIEKNLVDFYNLLFSFFFDSAKGEEYLLSVVGQTLLFLCLIELTC